MLPDLGTKLVSINKDNKPLFLINCTVLSVMADVNGHCLVVFKISLDEDYMGSVVVEGDLETTIQKIQEWGGVVLIKGTLHLHEAYTTQDGQAVIPIFGEIHPQEITMEIDTGELFNQRQIDPHFINRRKSFTVFGDKFYQLYKEFRDQNEEKDAQFFNNRLLCNLALRFCKDLKVKTLAEVLQFPQIGQICCSIDIVEGNEDINSKERIRNRIELPFDYEKEVFLDFGVEHFVATTGKYRQRYRNRVAIIGHVSNITDLEIIVDPIVMGDPIFDLPNYVDGDDAVDKKYYFINGISWLEGLSNYEVFVDDITEFSKCKNIQKPEPSEWTTYLQSVSENEIKQKLNEILGNLTKKDWGGELNDLFVSDIHIAETRLTAAFLLKGPAGGKYFTEMQPRMLGKNGDQIYRLSQSPAQLLVVQHCHDVGEAVRATLQNFAVAPHNLRKFCVMDGKDTYRVLKAYDKL